MSAANFLSGVSGTGREAPVNRELDSAGNAGLGDMGTQDFLKILMAQMQNQDPQNPMKQDEMMAQISQLTQLQQTQQLSEKIDGISTASRENQYISILGADVNIKTTDGKDLSGQLGSVKFQDGNTLLSVGGEEINADSVLSIGVDTP